MSLNQVALIGRLCKDVDVRYTANGTAVANFTLAVDRNYKAAGGQKETDFINIVVWRQQAENCARFLSKGKLVSVSGSLQIRSYENNEGQRRTIAEVLASYVQFLSPQGGGGGATTAPGHEDQLPMNNATIEDDDLPF